VSPREAEVLALLGEHLTNAEIGARLFISARTVESHVASLLRKLGAGDRRALAVVAAAQAAELLRGAGPHGAPPPRLPAPLTPFVGRRAERAALVAALGEHRLVTAIGPGGVGKTRLALEVGGDVADTFPDGVWYVDLVPVTDPVTVAASVARAAGLGEQVGRTSTETLVARFETARALLVLDNCEHVVHGVARLVEVLLATCPGLCVLATSQARLVVPHERPFPVEGLSSRAGGDAVALFTGRAQLAGWEPHAADGERIAALCDGLEGNALAIELAAARVTTVGLDGLEAGLPDRLSLLAGGARSNERHRSLRSAVAWSDGLLSDIERAVLRRCSVFAAAFPAAAAIDVAAGDTIDGVEVIAALGRLADHSLLVVAPRAAGTRYRMLETIRQYGHERLAELDELEEARTRHRVWCASAVDRLRQEPAAGPDADDVVAEARAALGWADGLAGNRLEAHRLALGLAELSFRWGLPTEAQGRYEQAAALAADDHAIAAACHAAAIVAACRLVGDDAVRLHRAAADAARRAGDRRGAALDLLRGAEFYDRFAGIMTTFPPADEAARLLADVRELAGDDDDVAAALAVVSRKAADPAEAIERGARSNDRWLRNAALDWRIARELSRGDPVAACATTQERFDVLDSGDAGGLELAFEFTDALHTATFAHLGAGRLAAARQLIERRRALRFLGDEDDLVVEGWLAVVGALRGHWHEVVQLDERSYAGLVRAERMSAIESALPPAAAAMVHGLRGDDARRRRWLDIVDAVTRTQLRGRGGSRGYGPVFAAMVALHRGDHDEAAAQLAEDPTALDTWQAGVWRQWYAALWAEAGVAAELGDARERVDLARRIVAGNPIAGAIVERTAALVARDPQGLRRAAAALEREGAPYQYARTLVLAGGTERATGVLLLEELGATAMSR
jgi:predicted ATPase/DNA-binding CsgD family transcriptional regulator